MALTGAVLAGGLLTGCGGANNMDSNATRGMKDVGYYGDQARRGNTGNVHHPANDRVQQNSQAPGESGVNNRTFTYDSDTTRRIASHVSQLNGVHDASVLMNGNTIVVGVTPDRNVKRSQLLEEKVRSTAKQLAPDKNVRVVTDRNIVRRMSNVVNRIDNGSAPKEVQSDVSGIFRDLGDIVKRPFQNNAK